MANKKSKIQKPIKPSEYHDKRRTRMIQIVVAIFSVMLVLSMVLQLMR